MTGSRTQHRWEPIAADRLPELLASWLARTSGATRVAIDGPPCADPGGVARSLVTPLRALGRPVAHVAAETFWHDASLRLEYGHEDLESYPSWLDAAALRRETLDPFGAGSDYLLSLRDPETNRATREAPQPFVPGTVLLVSGTFLLGAGLPFDRAVHLHLPPAARARRTPPDEAWTLPSFDRYDEAVRPVDSADVTVRFDRRSPAVLGLE